MFRALVFFIIGAVATYLYLNPGDIDGALKTGKEALNKGAQVVIEKTAD